jgi:hypothetical protein
MMMERLNTYQEKMGELPRRIIVFRDGVSEVSSSTYKTYGCLHAD